MPITVHEMGPDGTLVQTTIGDDAPAPDAAPAPAQEISGTPDSAPDGSMDGSAPPAAPAPAQEISGTPDSAPDGPATPETTEEDEDEAVPVRTKAEQKRFDRLFRQREEARRKNAVLEERLRMLEQEGSQRPAPPPPPEPPAPPSLERADYATDEEWLDARDTRLLAQAREDWQREQLHQRLQQEAQQRAAQIATREQTFAHQHPDYLDKLDSLRGRLGPQVWQALQDSEMGPDLAYHLASHADLQQQWNGMQPTVLLRAMGRLEQQLSAPPRPAPPPPTAKPAPPTPLNGAGSVGPRALDQLSAEDIDAMSQAEYMAAWQRTYPGSR